MDPSIAKFLEDDEDESLHSGAAVDAFTADLNRHIEEGPSTGVASQLTDPDPGAGEPSHGNSSGPMQLPEHWQSSTHENLGQQSQQKEQLHLQPPEENSSQIERIDSAKDQHQYASSQPERHQQLLQLKHSHSDHQQRQAETNSFQSAEKDQVPEQNLVQDPKLDRSQHSESQRQLATQQLNNQQVSGANDANSQMKRTRAAPSIPFHMLIPILRPNLDKDRSMQLSSVFAKLRVNEISKEDFLRVIRNIVGDQMLRQAAHKVQLQLQAENGRDAQTNPNQYSLQAQAASNPRACRGAMLTEPPVFPPPNPISSQNQKGHKSPPRQPHVPPSSLQMQTGTEFSNLDSKQDGKGIHIAQTYSTHMNMIPLPVNKQQHGQLPQTSFSMFGSTGGNFHAHAYPRPSASAAATSIKPEAQNSQMRQTSQAQGIGSTHSVMPKYELQSTSNESKRLHGASSTSHLPSQKNNAFQSVGYVKQEVVENSAEPSQKFQFSSPDGPFGSGHIDKGNQTLGSLKDDRLDRQSSRMGFSTSMTATTTNQVSGGVLTQTESMMQLHSHIPSATQPLTAGVPTKTPPKKPFGQKKPLETGGTSSPLSSKKQKTSGAFLDQSIEQLNDVTAVSGVNIREEEEQLLSAPKEDSRASEATRRVVQEEEERLILQKGPLQKKLTEIMSECGLEGFGSDVERCLSLCVEERLRGLISYLIRLSKQRVDIEKTRHQFVVTSDVRRQILLMNQKAKQEWDKKQAEEAEKLRKLNESEGNTGTEADKEKDENRSKVVKVNREEDDKMRTTAANVAARAAVGGDDMLSKWQLMAEQARQKRDGSDVGSTSQPGKSTNRKTLPTFARSLREQQQSEKRGTSSGGMRKPGRSQAAASHARVACNISVKDVIAVLEREPQMSKSELIYRLYNRLAGGSAAE